jgi:hypothetical protein
MTRQTVRKDSPVADAVRSAALDLDALVARVDTILADALYWLPVRHHSPAIAAQVGACIRDRQPKIVFIEGPYEAQQMHARKACRRHGPHHSWLALAKWAIFPTRQSGQLALEREAPLARIPPFERPKAWRPERG